MQKPEVISPYQQIFVDLRDNTLPRKVVADPQTYWHTLGDLHANTLKMMFFMRYYGIVQMGDEQYQTLVDFCDKSDKMLRFPQAYTKGEMKALYREWQSVLSNITPVKGAKVRFEGDTIGDRVGLDGYNIDSFYMLMQGGVSLQVLCGNHDVEVLLWFERLSKMKQPIVWDQSCYFYSAFAKDTPERQYASVVRLSGLCAQGILNVNEFLAKFNVVKQAFQSMSYDESPEGKELYIHSHASVNEVVVYLVVQGFLDQDNAAKPDNKIMSLDTHNMLTALVHSIKAQGKKQISKEDTKFMIDCINDIFRYNVDRNQLSTLCLLKKMPFDGTVAEYARQYPFQFLTWSRENPNKVFTQTGMEKNKETWCIHGHDKQPADYCQTLDNDHGKYDDDPHYYADALTSSVSAPTAMTGKSEKANHIGVQIHAFCNWMTQAGYFVKEGNTYVSTDKLKSHMPSFSNVFLETDKVKNPLTIDLTSTMISDSSVVSDADLVMLLYSQARMDIDLLSQTNDIAQEWKRLTGQSVAEIAADISYENVVVDLLADPAIQMVHQAMSASTGPDFDIVRSLGNNWKSFEPEQNTPESTYQTLSQANATDITHIFLKMVSARKQVLDHSEAVRYAEARSWAGPEFPITECKKQVDAVYDLTVLLQAKDTAVQKIFESFMLELRKRPFEKSNSMVQVVVAVAAGCGIPQNEAIAAYKFAVCDAKIRHCLDQLHALEEIPSDQRSPLMSYMIHALSTLIEEARRIENKIDDKIKLFDNNALSGGLDELSRTIQRCDTLLNHINALIDLIQHPKNHHDPLKAVNDIFERILTDDQAQKTGAVSFFKTIQANFSDLKKSISPLQKELGALQRPSILIVEDLSNMLKLSDQANRVKIENEPENIKPSTKKGFT